MFIFVIIGVSRGQTAFHTVEDEVNEYTIESQPTVFPVYVNDGTDPLSGADVYYELISTEIAGSVRSASSGYANVSFTAPTVGSYILATSANLTGYTSTLGTKTVNVYYGVYNTSGKPNPGGPYKTGEEFTYSGNIVEISCCFFKENSTEVCVCEYADSVTVEYFLDGSKIGDVQTDDIGNFQFNFDTTGYSTEAHTLVISPVRESYAGINDTESFSILSESIFSIAGTVQDATGSAVEVSITITNDSGTQYTTSSSSTYSTSLLEGSYDITIDYNSYQIVYDNLILNNDVNELIMIDQIPTSNSNLPLTITVQNAIGLRANNLPTETKSVKIPYSDSGVDEDLIEIQYCSSWDFTDRLCSGGWSTLSGTKDTANNFITSIFSSFGAFAIGEAVPGCEYDTCNSTCSTKSECESVGCNYCDTSCTQNACTTCHESNLTACTSESECSGVGGYFCNDVCESSPCCSDSSKTYCTDQSSCEGVGGTWCTADSTCGDGACCSAENLDLCLSYSTCDAVGGLWCATECSSTCATSGNNTNSVEYVYIEGDSTWLTFKISVYNPYDEAMENTVVTLPAVDEEAYFVTPESETIQPNETQEFTVSVNQELVSGRLDLSYDVEYYQLSSKGELLFFTFSNPLEIDWIGLFVDFLNPAVQPGENLELNITLSKTWEDVEKVALDYIVEDNQGNVIHESNDQQFLKDNLIFEDTIPIYANYTLGGYTLKLNAQIGQRTTRFERNFVVVKRFPWMQFFLFLVLPGFVILSIFVYLKYVRKPPEYVAVPAIKFGK